MIAVPALAFIFGALTWGQSGRPRLSKGVIGYIGENGQREIVDVGKPCSDLWVAPDGNSIAFIAIEKARPPATPFDQEPLIEESAIYFARRADHYRAVRVDFKSVSIDGNEWRVFRQPSLSPDLHTVYFLVPYTMTTWRLMSRPLPTGQNKTVSDAMTYCVVWGGGHSGDVLIMVREEPTVHPPIGVIYPCYVSAPSGSRVMLADGISQDCWEFGDFAARWSRANGGACSQ
jgi:hypothetical protein